MTDAISQRDTGGKMTYYLYDAISHTRVDFGNCAWQSFQYNNDARHLLMGIDYAYKCAPGDTVSNRGGIRLTRNDGGSPLSWADTSDKFIKQFAYDAQGRLTEADIPGSGRTAYGWDWVANRTVPTAAYNDADQLTSFGGSSYAYNATGATQFHSARGATRHMPAVRRTALPAAHRAACPRAAGALMASGVFTQRDPELDGVNWYAYVSDAVMTAVDPSGRSPVIRIPSGISWLCKFFPDLKWCKQVVKPISNYNKCSHIYNCLKCGREMLEDFRKCNDPTDVSDEEWFLGPPFYGSHAIYRMYCHNLRSKYGDTPFFNWCLEQCVGVSLDYLTPSHWRL